MIISHDIILPQDMIGCRYICNDVVSGIVIQYSGLKSYTLCIKIASGHIMYVCIEIASGHIMYVCIEIASGHTYTVRIDVPSGHIRIVCVDVASSHILYVLM